MQQLREQSWSSTSHTSTDLSASSAHADGHGVPYIATPHLARPQKYATLAAAPTPKRPSRPNRFGQGVTNSSPTSSLPDPAGSIEEDVPGRGAPSLPPGFAHIRHKHYVEYGVQCPAHGLKTVRNYEQLERLLNRPDWAGLVQRVGESQHRYRKRLLVQGLHFSLGLMHKVHALPHQTATAERREQPSMRTGPPVAAAAAAAPSGVQAAALPAQGGAGQGGQMPGVPGAPSAGWFAELYQEFQRATEQLVQDMLQEQRAFMEEQTQQNMKLFQKENMRWRQELKGLNQQALLQQDQQSPASCQASEEKQRIRELESANEHLRQELDCLKEQQRSTAPGQATVTAQDGVVGVPPQSQQHRLVPVTMDQVLLDGGGGNSVLLARIKDGDGCWLCLREVYRKLCNSMPESTWHQYTHSAAQGRKSANPEERRFLRATGALLSDHKDAVLVSVDVALYACGKARVGAPLLEAMAQFAELQPYSTPPVPQAQPLPAPTSGHCARVPPQKKKKKKISLHPLPAGRLSQPPSPPQGVLDTQRPAAELQQEAHQVPATMDQVLLVWDGGRSEVLARVRDAEGCWLCSREVNKKLGGDAVRSTWNHRVRRGAAGQGWKMATPEAVNFLAAAGAHRGHTGIAVLISVDMAITACDKAGRAAPQLAAMARIAELQPYSAPALPQAQRAFPGNASGLPPVRAAEQAAGVGTARSGTPASSSTSGDLQPQQWGAMHAGGSREARADSASSDDSATAKRLNWQRQVQAAMRLAQGSAPAKRGSAAATAGTKRKRELGANPFPQAGHGRPG